MAESNEDEASSVAAQAIEIIGDATPEQVAALVAVILAASGAEDEGAPGAHPSPWSSPAGLVRRPVTPGARSAGTWQRSLR